MGEDLTRVATAAAAVAVFAAPPIGAQTTAPNDEPRASALLGVGAGGTPDLSRSLPGSSTAAILGTAGVRRRAPRLFFVDASVHLQGDIGLGDEVAIVPYYQPGTTYRRYPTRVRELEWIASNDVRIGVEGHAEPGRGPLVRLSAGGGYVWQVRAPYATAVAGVGTQGRRARLTLDVEHRWLRLPLEEFAARQTTFPQDLVVTRTRHVGAAATFLRVGIERPLRRP